MRRARYRRNSDESRSDTTETIGRQRQVDPLRSAPIPQIRTYSSTEKETYIFDCYDESIRDCQEGQDVSTLKIYDNPKTHTCNMKMKPKLKYISNEREHFVDPDISTNPSRNHRKQIEKIFRRQPKVPPIKAKKQQKTSNFRFHQNISGPFNKVRNIMKKKELSEIPHEVSRPGKITTTDEFRKTLDELLTMKQQLSTIVFREISLFQEPHSRNESCRISCEQLEASKNNDSSDTEELRYTDVSMQHKIDQEGYDKSDEELANIYSDTLSLDDNLDNVDAINDLKKVSLDNDKNTVCDNTSSNNLEPLSALFTKGICGCAADSSYSVGLDKLIVEDALKENRKVILTKIPGKLNITDDIYKVLDKNITVKQSLQREPALLDMKLSVMENFCEKENKPKIGITLAKKLTSKMSQHATHNSFAMAHAQKCKEEPTSIISNIFPEAAKIYRISERTKTLPDGGFHSTSGISRTSKSSNPLGITFNEIVPSDDNASIKTPVSGKLKITEKMRKNLEINIEMKLSLLQNASKLSALRMSEMERFYEAEPPPETEVSRAKEFLEPLLEPLIPSNKKKSKKVKVQLTKKPSILRTKKYAQKENKKEDLDVIRPKCQLHSIPIDAVKTQIPSGILRADIIKKPLLQGKYESGEETNYEKEKKWKENKKEDLDISSPKCQLHSRPMDGVKTSIPSGMLRGGIIKQSLRWSKQEFEEEKNYEKDIKSKKVKSQTNLNNLKVGTETKLLKNSKKPSILRARKYVRKENKKEDIDVISPKGYLHPSPIDGVNKFPTSILRAGTINSVLTNVESEKKENDSLGIDATSQKETVSMAYSISPVVDIETVNSVPTVLKVETKKSSKLNDCVEKKISQNYYPELIPIAKKLNTPHDEFITVPENPSSMKESLVEIKRKGLLKEHSLLERKPKSFKHVDYGNVKKFREKYIWGGKINQGTNQKKKKQDVIAVSSECQPKTSSILNVGDYVRNKISTSILLNEGESIVNSVSTDTKIKSLIEKSMSLETIMYDDSIVNSVSTDTKIKSLIEKSMSLETIMYDDSFGSSLDTNTIDDNSAPYHSPYLDYNNQKSCELFSPIQSFLTEVLPNSFHPDWDYNSFLVHIDLKPEPASKSVMQIHEFTPGDIAKSNGKKEQKHVYPNKYH